MRESYIKLTNVYIDINISSQFTGKPRVWERISEWSLTFCCNIQPINWQNFFFCFFFSPSAQEVNNSFWDFSDFIRLQRFFPDWARLSQTFRTSETSETFWESFQIFSDSFRLAGAVSFPTTAATTSPYPHSSPAQKKSVWGLKSLWEFREIRKKSLKSGKTVRVKRNQQSKHLWSLIKSDKVWKISRSLVYPLALSARRCQCVEWSSNVLSVLHIWYHIILILPMVSIRLSCKWFSVHSIYGLR